MPGLALGPAMISLLIHAIVLSVVAGTVLIQQAPVRAEFEAQPEVDLPLITEAVPAPAEVDDMPSPEPEAPGTDDGAPATAMGSLDQPIVDAAMEVVAVTTSTNAFLVRSGVGLKTGTDMVGLGNKGIGIGQGSGKGNGGKGSPAISTKEIFGMKVQAERIAVVLDCSGSMLGVLEPVIKEILGSFPNAIIIGAQGCAVFPSSVLPIDTRLEPVDKTRDPSAKFLCNSLPYDLQKTSLWSRRGPGGALVQQANEGSVQAVYWFADFQDPIESKGMRDITDALVRAGIRLYVHSVERHPDPAIEEAVEETGGQIIIKKIK